MIKSNSKWSSLYAGVSVSIGVSATVKEVADSMINGLPSYRRYAQRDPTGILLSDPVYGTAILAKAVAVGAAAGAMWPITIAYFCGSEAKGNEPRL